MLASGHADDCRSSAAEDGGALPVNADARLLGATLRRGDIAEHRLASRSFWPNLSKENTIGGLQVDAALNPQHEQNANVDLAINSLIIETA